MHHNLAALFVAHGNDFDRNCTIDEVASSDRDRMGKRYLPILANNACFDAMRDPPRMGYPQRLALRILPG